MFATPGGWAVERLLRRVLANPNRYRRLVVCAPFIDAHSTAFLSAIARRTAFPRCSVVIITTPFQANRLRGSIVTESRALVTIVTCRRLHAKIYLLEGRRPEESEAIVTSANLTDYGLRANAELGVRAVPTSKAGQRLYDDTATHLRCVGSRGGSNERNARLVLS
jgi:hypothetical protein